MLDPLCKLIHEVLVGKSPHILRPTDEEKECLTHVRKVELLSLELSKSNFYLPVMRKRRQAATSTGESASSLEIDR